MKRLTVTLCAMVIIAVPVFLNAQETQQADTSQTQSEKSLAEQLKENPDDTALINRYMIQNLQQLNALMSSDVDGAEKLITTMKEVVESLEPTTDPGKRLVNSAKRAVASYGQRIALMKIPYEELIAALKENPDDMQSLSKYQSKLMMEISGLTRSDPDTAEKMLKSAKELVTTIKERTEQDATKAAIERLERSFDSIEKRIEIGKRLATLVGSEAAPLEVETWVNGEPLTDADLKGKVVLLDFWAVWCGPCIQTFPHLREWHEKYADKGLIIIGLTRYYQYQWNEEAGRAVKAKEDEEVTPEQEQEMLVKFAEHYNLHHRFAIQKDSTLSDYYAVSGIPHVVVIDQEGTIRLFRIGSGDQNAKDISEMLEKLLGS